MVNIETQENGCVAYSLHNIPAGTGCFFSYDDVGWIGYMAVLPQYQRRGIGTAIIEYLLEELDNLGVKTVRLDSSEAGYHLYKNFGFVDEYKTTMFELPEKVSDMSEKVITTQKISEGVKKMDVEIFGADRLKAIRAWLNHGAKILEMKDGYALLKMNSAGPIIATDYHTAQILLMEAILRGAKNITIPEANNSAIKLMKDVGAVWRHNRIRMRRGPPVKEHTDKIYGILSYAKG